MNDPTLKTYQDKFEHFLLQHPAPSQLLPSLMEEKKKDPSFWEKFFQSLESWFKNAPAPSSVSSSSLEGFFLVLKILFVVLVFSLVCGLIYLLIRSFKRNKKDSSSWNSAPLSPSALTASHDLAELSEKNPAQRARFYWKQFLKSKQLAPSMTLEEWKRSFHSPNSEAPFLETSQLMFGTVSQPESILEEWKKWMEAQKNA